MANTLTRPIFQEPAIDEEGRFGLYYQRFLNALYTNLLTIIPAQPQGLLVFADNAAAIAGGLSPGNFYRTGSDPDFLCVVH